MLYNTGHPYDRFLGRHCTFLLINNDFFFDKKKAIVVGFLSFLLKTESSTFQPDNAEAVSEEIVCQIQSKAVILSHKSMRPVISFKLLLFKIKIITVSPHTRLFTVCSPASPSLCFLSDSVPQYGKSLPSNPFTLQLNLYTVQV